jgi:hypothetical protein
MPCGLGAGRSVPSGKSRVDENAVYLIAENGPACIDMS